MPTTSPTTLARQAVAAALTTEFTPEGIVTRADRMHASLGHRGPFIAVYPALETESDGDASVLVIDLVVQLYRQYDRQIKPEQAVDPAGIEEWVERARRAIRGVTFVTSSQTWFLRQPAAQYPPDPTGNITRAELEVLAYAKHSGVHETTG